MVKTRETVPGSVCTQASNAVYEVDVHEEAANVHVIPNREAGQDMDHNSSNNIELDEENPVAEDIVVNDDTTGADARSVLIMRCNDGEQVSAAEITYPAARKVRDAIKVLEKH